MSHFETPEKVNIQIQETLALLDKMHSPDEALCKNIVLFVGVTGSGKSTFSQFLAGNSKLKATREGTEFLITDGDDKVSVSTTKSKTLFPELVPIPNTDTVLADCPGFSDTRSAKHDIAATVFTKQLLDKTKQVKFIITTSHHSVRTGLAREAFPDLLAHMVRFIKNIDKYKHSIGLLVTKVENLYEPDDDGNIILIPDNMIVNEIGSFLDRIKIELTAKNNCYSLARQIQILDILSAKDGRGDYSKIGIFRRPAKIGDLHVQQPLMKNLNAFNSIMHHVLQSGRVTANDFGLTLSAESQYIVTKMRDALNIELSNILDDYFRVYSQQLSISTEVDSMDTIKSAISRSHLISGLLANDFVPNMVVTNLMERINNLDPDHPAQLMAAWKKQQKLMQFLETIFPSENDADDFKKYHGRLVAFKNKISDNMKLIGRNAEDIVNHAIGEVILVVMIKLLQEIQDQGVPSKMSYLELSKATEKACNGWRRFKTNNEKRVNLDFKEFLDNLKSHFELSNSHINKLAAIQKDIVFFKKHVNATFTDGQQAKWLQGFIAPLNKLESLAEWYSFIAASYSKIVVGDIKNIKTYKNWNDFKKLIEKFGTDETCKRILDSRSTLSLKEQMDLNNLIDSLELVCLTPYDYSFTSTKLVVKDSFVKLSKVKMELFPTCSSFTELYIFATETVSIDASLLEPGKNIYIIAPMWKIEGSQLINLRGLDATSKGLTNSSKAGNPGHPGGNFIGIGEKFVNGKNLTVDVSGGRGSNGLDGEGGHPGANGTISKKFFAKSYHLTLSCAHQLKKLIGYAQLVSSTENQKKYKLFGAKGSGGGNGGHGGMPGYGGRAGIIAMTSHEVVKIQNDGQPGIGGRGGKGGQGGLHGDNQYINCDCTTVVAALFYDHSYTFERFESQGRAENGSNGDSGVAGNPVKAATPRSYSSVTKVADQYKEYIKAKGSLFVDSLKFIERL